MAERAKCGVEAHRVEHRIATSNCTPASSICLGFTRARRAGWIEDTMRCAVRGDENERS